jgi:hypothetical protein
MAREKLIELIGLLTCGQVEPDEIEASADAVLEAQDDPEFDWVHEMGASDGEFMQIALMFELSSFFADGDKIDEFHEQVSEFFKNPLPDFPYPANKMDFPPSAYFKWLDDQLAARDPAYALMLMDNRIDDMLRGILVRRASSDRALELAEELGIGLERSTDRP